MEDIFEMRRLSTVSFSHSDAARNKNKIARNEKLESRLSTLASIVHHGDCVRPVIINLEVCRDVCSSLESALKC